MTFGEILPPFQLRINFEIKRFIRHLSQHRISNFEDAISLKQISKELQELNLWRKEEVHLRLGDNRSNDGLQYKAKRYIPFFGEDINALTYLNWEGKIDILHLFFAGNSNSYILSICISRFERRASEWWNQRQSLIQDCNPPSFEKKT